MQLGSHMMTKAHSFKSARYSSHVTLDSIGTSAEYGIAGLEKMWYSLIAGSCLRAPLYCKLGLNNTRYTAGVIFSRSCTA